MSGMMRRLRAAQAETERGFTLVELLVAIVVLAILLTMVSSLFISSLKVVTLTEATSQGTGNASNVIDEVARAIRSGTEATNLGNANASPAFLVGQPESITFYSYVDSYVPSPSAACPLTTSACATQVQPQIVQFAVDPTTRQVVEKRWKPLSSSGDSYSFPAYATATPTYNHTIGGPLLVTASGAAAVFTYLDSTGKVIPTPSSGLSCALLATVRSVTVTIRVAGATASARPAVVLQNTIQLPNLGAAGDTTC
jgi:prepilin-type N-terminal cleavage/methylation domain-containing protein